MSDIIWEGANELRAFLVPIDSVVDYPTNPFRGDIHVEDLAKSLRDYGQLRPILVWDNAHEVDPELESRTIIAGHHVRKGAEFGKWTHVAVVHHQFESRHMAEAFLALDNVLSVRKPSEIRDQMSLLGDMLEGYSEELKENLRQASQGAEVTSVADLKLHERSIRQDPERVIEMLSANLAESGFTEDVIVARDGTILTGESVLKAAALAGIDKIPVKRVDVDPDSAEAAKIMARHYTAGKHAMVDDRAFAELLVNIKDELGSLEGTGYDPEMLAGLLLVSRTAAEIKDATEAYEWMGLSEYAPVSLPSKLILSFENDEARELFMGEVVILPSSGGSPIVSLKQNLGTVSAWWPPRGRQDPASLRFEGKDRPAGAGEHLPAHDIGLVHADAELLAVTE